MAAEEPQKLVRFDDLNALGKSVFLAGSVVRMAAGLLDLALDRTARIMADTERAFRQGRDPNVEDAKILDETQER